MSRFGQVLEETGNETLSIFTLGTNQTQLASVEFGSVFWILVYDQWLKIISHFIDFELDSCQNLKGIL